jgi:hypothetical protein
MYPGNPEDGIDPIPFEQPDDGFASVHNGRVLGALGAFVVPKTAL